MSRWVVGWALAQGVLLLFATLGSLPAGESGHRLLGTFAALVVLGGSALASWSLRADRRWVEAATRTMVLPDSCRALALRNERRARPFAIGLVVVIGLAGLSGGWDRARLAHGLAGGLALGFGLGGTLLLALSLGAQGTLRRAAPRRGEARR